MTRPQEGRPAESDATATGDPTLKCLTLPHPMCQKASCSLASTKTIRMKSQAQAAPYSSETTEITARSKCVFLLTENNKL